MNKITNESLTSLLEQAQESAADILKQFKERLQATAVQPSEAADPTARRWALEMTAAQARVQLRDVHRRLAHTVSTMQLRNVISDGEATSVQQALERLLGTSLNEIEQQVGRVRNGK